MSNIKHITEQIEADIRKPAIDLSDWTFESTADIDIDIDDDVLLKLIYDLKKKGL